MGSGKFPDQAIALGSNGAVAYNRSRDSCSGTLNASIDCRYVGYDVAGMHFDASRQRVDR